MDRQQWNSDKAKALAQIDALLSDEKVLADAERAAEFKKTALKTLKLANGRKPRYQRQTDPAIVLEAERQVCEAIGPKRFHFYWAQTHYHVTAYGLLKLRQWIASDRCRYSRLCPDFISRSM